MSTVNFSEFLSCLGMTVQETTTLTATFTQTTTLSSGYTTFTVGGCTPAGFPYSYCPEINENTATAGPDFDKEPPLTTTTSLLWDGGLITAPPGIFSYLYPHTFFSYKLTQEKLQIIF
jgi:hypothetical protein